LTSGLLIKSQQPA